MTAVTLRSYREDEKKIYEGDGLQINNKNIIAHYSTLGLKQNNLSNGEWQHIPLRVCQTSVSRHRVKQIPLSIVHVWQCLSFSRYFQNYLNASDFGNKDVQYCATFVLLKTEADTGEKTVDIPNGKNTYATRGARVTVKNSGEVKWSLLNRQQKDEDSIISYTFGCGHYFTVDADVVPGSIVYRRGSDTDEEVPTGLAVYTDVLPHPFQVFPLCISLKHLLSKQCRNSSCACVPSSTKLTPNGSSLSGVYLVQCGSKVGSGFLISRKVILTCSHILSEHNESGVTVYWNDVSSKATIIYMNNKGWPDIALVEISPIDIDAASILTIASRPLALDERVLAAGIPYVKGWYEADAWLSSGRIVNISTGQIITSCSVHEGFSGGCLLDRQGQVLGVICGKAFPFKKTKTPPRLTQVIPITGLKVEILKFVNTTPRTQKDTERLTKSFLSSRQLNRSKL